MLKDAYHYLLDRNLVYVNTKSTVKDFKALFEESANNNNQKRYECDFVLDLIKKDLKIYGTREVVWVNLELIEGNYIPTGYTLPMIQNESEYAYYIETTLAMAYDIFTELNQEE